MRTTTIILFTILQGCSLLDTGDVSVVEAQITRHVIDKRCEWSEGIATEFFVLDKDYRGVLCGDYGDIGQKLSMSFVEDHKDSKRNGLKTGDDTIYQMNINKGRL